MKKLLFLMSLCVIFSQTQETMSSTKGMLSHAHTFSKQNKPTGLVTEQIAFDPTFKKALAFDKALNEKDVDKIKEFVKPNAPKLKKI